MPVAKATHLTGINSADRPNDCLYPRVILLLSYTHLKNTYTHTPQLKRQPTLFFEYLGKKQPISLILGVGYSASEGPKMCPPPALVNGSDRALS